MATAPEPIINILGERVALGPPTREQIPLFARWRNDFFVQRTAGSLPAPITIEVTATQFEEWAKREEAYWFVIYERATW